MPSYTEEDVTNALNALVNGKIKPARKAASIFQIPYATLQIDHYTKPQIIPLRLLYIDDDISNEL
jgi:hypothetical protein